MSLNLFVTLSPSMSHFQRFAQDSRIQGIRINSAMMFADEIDTELSIAQIVRTNIPMYYDVKGRQLRIVTTYPGSNHLEIDINHPLTVDTPTTVLFKSGCDHAQLVEVKPNGKFTRLVFAPREPHYNVIAGESIHIRHPSLKITGPTFPDYEVEKIKKVKNNGFTRWCLSYCECQQNIDDLRALVGQNDEIVLKIENKPGLAFVKKYQQQKNTSLLAARGDLYVELDRPHEILSAMKTIIKADPGAVVGSRLLLSCVEKSVPDATDFSELAWMYDIGYRRILLCDELCTKEDRLARAVNVFDAFRTNYPAPIPFRSKPDPTICPSSTAARSKTQPWYCRLFKCST